MYKRQDNNPLWIKTDSELGSRERIDVWFYDQDNDHAGGIGIGFGDKLDFEIGGCSNDKEFPTTPPTTVDKIWKITLDKTSGIRVMIHCNGVEVLDVLLSDEYCNSDNSWRDYWSMAVKKIAFRTRYDTASDYYALEDPNGKSKYFNICFTRNFG